MRILRKCMPDIIKYKFKKDMFVKYSDEQLKCLENLLINVIENYTISTIDCITYLRKHYKGNMNNAINCISNIEANNIRFNCIYQTTLLIDLLKKYHIKGYVVSYKSSHFTTPESERKFKESHTSVFIPTIIKNRKCFIILDPGLKIYKPIYLFTKRYISKVDQLSIKIDKTYNKKYPLYILLDGVNKYSYNQKPHKVYQVFDNKYYIKNPIKLIMPEIYKYLKGYRATIFSLDERKRSSLTIYPVSQKIVIFKDKIEYTYLYEDINNTVLDRILPDICNRLNINIDETKKNILFMKKYKDEFLNLMDRDTVEKYKKDVNL